MKFRAHVIETSAGFGTECEALNEDYKFAGMSQNFAYEGNFRTEKEKCFSRVVLSSERRGFNSRKREEQR